MSTMGFITMKTPLKGEHVFLLFPSIEKANLSLRRAAGRVGFQNTIFGSFGLINSRC